MTNVGGVTYLGGTIQEHDEHCLFRGMLCIVIICVHIFLILCILFQIWDLLIFL